MTDAIEHLFDRLKAGGYPGAQLGGIYADKPGYHNRRDQLPASDYSVQRPDDQAGSGQWAAGLDITLHNPGDLMRLTQQLIDLTHAHDPRVQVLREFLGTVDGFNVTGMDVRDVRWITSDDSHLWHAHLSIYRRYAGDQAALDALADAILGDSTDPIPEMTAMFESFNFEDAVYVWSASSLWHVPNISYLDSLKRSHLYAGDLGTVDRWFFDAARALVDTSSEPS